MRKEMKKYVHSLIAAFVLASGFVLVAPGAWAQPAGGPGDMADQPPSQPKNYFTVIWREGVPETRIQRVDELEELEAPTGFVLVDLEISGLGSDRQYAGVYREGSGVSRLHTEMSLGALAIKNQALESDGFCLRGIETTGKDNQIRFAGIWRPGCSGAVLENDLSPIDFADRLQELGESFHLVDFETSIKEGLLRVTGLWHPGAETRRIWSSIGLDWFTFHDQIHQRSGEGLELDHLDVQIKSTIQEEGLDPVLNPKDWPAMSGVWRQRPLGSKVQGQDWLGSDYAWSQVEWVDEQLDSGEGVAALDHPGDEDADPNETLSIDRIYLNIAAIEMTPRRVYLDPCRMHSGPLHDSGTAGPP